MKRLFVLLSILTLFITGCSVTNLSNQSIDKVIDKVMKKDSKLKNVNFEGYNYYVPKGMTFINKNQYNAIFRDQYNSYYYLYVDAVSYYHKIKSNYKINKKAYYSKSIKTKNKFGYLEINKEKQGYFIEAMYNYVKIEAYVNSNDLMDSVTNISTILASVKYNDKVLASTVGENVLSYKEKSYNIFETKKNSSDFLNYVKEYDNIKKNSDEDNLKIEEGE